MSDVSLETIVSLCKRRGFIYQGSEVYGGLSGTWDYGPLGVALKRNIMDLWWKTFVDDRDDMLGVDSAILMNQKVWQASGHATGFNDPLVECKNCKSRFRADHLIEKEIEKNKKSPNALIYEQPDGTVGNVNANLSVFRPKCPNCGTENAFKEARQFNMMFSTKIGPTANQLTVPKEIAEPGIYDEVIEARQDSTDPARVYLRPETAQGIFTNYKNVVDSFYPDLPFGIAQQGKAFRNEISPRDFVFRSREFEQMEIEYFIHEKEWEAAFKKWVVDIEAFLEELGLPGDKIHKLEVPDADRAHYSKRTIDFEYDFPIGREELLGLAYRTDFDLMNIQKASGKSMEYRPKDGGAPFVPHVIEPSFGVERAIMAVLASAYTEDEINGEKRSYLKLPAHLAPVKVAVSPLLKNKPELVAKAQEVYKMLKKEFGAVTWDDNGNVGKRYRRSDEIGTPYHVTIDFDTLQDDTVTVRHRDTTEQERVKINAIKLIV